MPIHLRGFAGEIPRFQPRYLPDQNAAIALGARLNRGDLEPMRAPTANPVHVASAPAGAIVKVGTTWMAFADSSVRVASGPVATERTYISSDANPPRLRAPSGTEYPLALPAPTLAPVLTRGGTLDDALAEMTLFAYTFVTGFGEESQPSPLAGILWSPGCTVTLGSMQVPPGNRNITRKRIYRSQTSAGGATELFFVAEITGSNVSYTHNLEAAPLQEAIPSTDYDPPPDALTGLTVLPNGIMAAFAGKELLFCEPYQPHAWPVKYRQAIADPIVALAAFGSSLAVLTTGQPWIVQGLHPEAMAMQKLEQPFPCVAPLGVVDMGYAAIYPSTDGLVQVSEQGAALMSEALWTRDQWNALTPSTFRAAQFGGRYVFSYKPGAAPRAIGIVDPRGQQPFLARADVQALALFTDLPTGKLYMLDAADSLSVREFDSFNAARMSYQWRSKPWFFARPTGFGAVFVEAPEVMAGSEVRIIADGVTILTIPHTRFNRMVRLPAGRPAVWEVEAVGSSTITRISLGVSPVEVEVMA